MVLAFITSLLNFATAMQTLEADNILYRATIYSRQFELLQIKATPPKFFRGGDVVPLHHESTLPRSSFDHYSKYHSILKQQ